MLLSAWFDLLSLLPATLLHGNMLWSGATVSTGLAGASLHRRCIDLKGKCAREARLRHELAAYVVLDFAAEASGEEFARQVSRTVATRSSFPRAAVLLRDADNHLRVMGSAGMDDLSVQALNRWGAAAGAEPQADGKTLGAGGRVGRSSFLLQLERRGGPNPETISRLSCGRVLVIPMQTRTGLVGAIAVCAQPREGMRAGKKSRMGLFFGLHCEPTTEELLEPLEALAVRLATRLREAREGAGRRKVRLGTRPAEGPPAVELPSRRRKLDASNAPALSGVGLFARLRVLEMERTGRAGVPEHESAGAHGFPPARLWSVAAPQAQ